jgi:hypothetical protein
MFRANESHADKARIVVNGVANEGTHIVEKGVRNASLSQERFWNIASRTIDRINANSRWSIMLYRLKVLHHTEIDISKTRPSHKGITEVGIAEVGIAEVGIAEAGITLQLHL